MDTHLKNKAVERAGFEKWLRLIDEPFFRNPKDGKYDSVIHEVMWKAWQARAVMATALSEVEIK